MIRGLMIKVINTEEIMEAHKKASDAKKHVWYCYFGDPVTKPYDKGYANAFFLKCGIIRELNHDKALKYMYYEKRDKPYNPLKYKLQYVM
jgi:hypothetical protein